MKENYLKRLRELLDRYDMSELEKQDIIDDYDEMYDGWVEKGYDEEEVERKLGRPRFLISSLTEGFEKAKKEQTSEKGTKIIALSPFISLIAFFIIGFGFGGWAYGWLAFLFIPVIAIIMNMWKDEQMTTALSPFAAVIAYFIMGFYHNLWHPGWLVFLIIPVLGIWNSRRDMKFFELLTALSPFASLIAIILLGEHGLWNPGWLVFMSIPFFGILNDRKFSRMILSEFLLLVGVFGYFYYYGLYPETWGYGLLAFAPFVIYQMIIGNISLTINSEDTPRGYKVVVLLTVITYLVVSLGLDYFLDFNLWGYTWLIWFAIPMYAIIRETKPKERDIALTPFIAVIILMVAGYFGMWLWGTMALLLIPIVAIIKSV